MTRYLTGCTLLVVAVLAGPSAASASVPIEVGDDFFAPRKASLELGGGGFDWRWGADGLGTANSHNVVQDNGLFDSGEPVTEDPDGFSATASAGSFPYYCQVHGTRGGRGMAGVVKVRPTATANASGGVLVSWASDETTTGSRYDVRYQKKRKGKRKGKKWKLWQKKTSKTSAVFGRKGKPVKLKRTKPVKLQVRSRRGKAKSDWSPTLKLTASG